MILSRSSLALTSVLLLTITSSSPALGFVAPFASSRACRAVAFVSQPVPLSDLDAVPSGDDNDVGAEEAAVPFEDADDDSADFKSPSFSKPQRHTLFVGNVPFGMSVSTVLHFIIVLW
mgnify:CR=1 FL=1